jgi:multidrug efflux pump subunit AcrB
MALQLGSVATNAAASIADNRTVEVQAGAFFVRPEEVRDLVVGQFRGAPVFLRDVAEVSLGPDDPERYVWLQSGVSGDSKGLSAGEEKPAVTLAIAKKSGVNAATVAAAVEARLQQLRGTYIPDDVQAVWTRNYGQTATDKANTLIKKLFLVTLVVVALVYFALGAREAVVVGAAVIVTLTVTLFASWAFGFTINRVSLFALIFSIGILVDDAIVVVENIHRHWHQGELSLKECIPIAVDEVGGPTILATFTVIAALLPMAFVSGLMGPYMSPIPINASAGMFISLLVAFSLTPWMIYHVLKAKHGDEDAACKVSNSLGAEKADPKLLRLFSVVFQPFLDRDKGRRNRWLLLAGVLVLIAGSIGLVAGKAVILKMLPFDNKSEFQVVVDMPEGVSLERTAEATKALAAYLATVPEVTDVEAYVGTASPINFNGLVRQYYLRRAPNMADLQVNLLDKHERDRKSHDIALSVRGPLQAIAARYDANVKVVEVPPGPPVLAPVVAEVYGQNYPRQQALARKIETAFRETDGLVDIDTSVEAPTKRYIVHVDRQKAARLGVSQASISRAINAALAGEDASYLHSDTAKYPTPIRLEVPEAWKADPEQFLLLKVRSRSGALVPVKDLVQIEETTHEQTIYHKDLLPVVYVMGDGAGETDSPLYGMFELLGRFSDEMPDMEQALTAQPDNPYLPSIKWDGEWQVTYETFRDMGIAYGVGLIIIYLLVVAEFRSYITPLVIMAPIPLTMIGIMPGHALLGEQFTATSMIGMIALAGIIVRNSILLVDFINIEVARGVAFTDAVVRSAAIRAKPILLTALAAVLDALFILDDPIFAGLAVSLIFGVAVSTLLTLVVIPVVYYASREREWA